MGLRNIETGSRWRLKDLASKIKPPKVHLNPAMCWTNSLNCEGRYHSTVAEGWWSLVVGVYGPELVLCVSP